MSCQAMQEKDGRLVQVHCLTLVMLRSKDAHDAAKLQGAIA